MNAFDERNRPPRLARTVELLSSLAPRLLELGQTGGLPPDVVEALALDFESRWASMDVILSAYEGLPFHREVECVPLPLDALRRTQPCVKGDR